MEDSSLEKINQKNIPQHIAIIMDGNGRWAKDKGKTRTFGHVNALKAIKAVIESCKDFGIKYLTLYAFSTENWNRPIQEVSFLMKLISVTVNKEIKELHKNNIKLNIIGNIDKLPSQAKNDIKKAIKLTENNTGSVLTLALNYGSREELLYAVKKIAKDYRKGNIHDDDFNEELINKNLFTHNLPMVDLMIRTSGENRISNFLLWQIAYAELYFTTVYWPDFTKIEFAKAIENYQSRERRYGKISEQLTN